MTHIAPPTPAHWPQRAVDPILVVGPNPAMDRLEVISKLDVGEVHRVREVRARAGGKSFIVARSIRALGPRVQLHGFLGGATGELAHDECRRLQIIDRHTQINADTRITVVIVESKTGRSTVLNEPGPSLSAAEEEAFWRNVDDALEPGQIVVCTGSLPPTLGVDAYARVVASARKMNAYVAIDASGKVLRSAVKEHPWLIKCNLHEFLSLMPGTITENTGDIARRMTELVDQGTGIVIVTMGGDDFLVATSSGVWGVTVPRVPVINATGSGDTFLAVFVAAVQRGNTLADALRLAAAGGAFNASQLEPGLVPGADLTSLTDDVRFSTLHPAALG